MCRGSAPTPQEGSVQGSRSPLKITEGADLCQGALWLGADYRVARHYELLQQQLVLGIQVVDHPQQVSTVGKFGGGDRA